LVAARHLTLLPGTLHLDARIASREVDRGAHTAPYPTWHDAGRKRKRTGLWTFFWVGGSSKGLADSNGEFSQIKSEDRPFEKAQGTGHPESQRLCHPPKSASSRGLGDIYQPDYLLQGIQD
jgi:hypothetical protein